MGVLRVDGQVAGEIGAGNERRCDGGTEVPEVGTGWCVEVLVKAL